MKQLHDKIKELQLRVGSAPISYSGMKFDHRVKKPTADSRLIKAYHAVWGVPDDYGTICVRGCFTKSIQERGPLSQAKQKIVVIYMHDQRDPLCLPSLLQEDDYGLYSEWSPDEVPSGDRTVLQVRSGTINQFSFGFNYVWDKMEYDEQSGCILMKECNLYELSPVTIGSNKETFAVRSKEQRDEELGFLQEETEAFISSMPRGKQLELRQLITRHISLAQIEPLETRKALDENKPIASEEVKLLSMLNDVKLF